MGLKKIGLIGAGNIGTTLACLILQRQIGDVILFDIKEGKIKGNALDLEHASAIDDLGCKITSTANYADLNGCDAVIVTAGLPRSPGMSRDDLLKINGSIIKNIGENIAKHCPDAFVVVVTNPLDVMVWQLQKSSGLPKNKVVGMAGILDTGRFISFLAKRLNIHPRNIQTFVLGGHGDTMVAVPSHTTVAGVPIMDLVEQGKISKEELDEIIKRTQNGGGEIVKLLETGSAYFAPASAALQMVEAYLFDQKRALPCAAWLNGEYGFKDIYAGVPVVIGKNGAEQVIELALDEQEKQNLAKSVDAVKELISSLQNLG